MIVAAPTLSAFLVLLILRSRIQITYHGVPTSSTALCNHKPIRLNKVFKATHSRRAADALIAAKRVSINDSVVDGGMVVPFRDVIKLDGKVVEGWEALNGIFNTIDGTTSFASSSTKKPSTAGDTFEYIKYWKPVVGVNDTN